MLPWTVEAHNLPEHARNRIHTDAGARAAGFPAALVAGVTTYGYLCHPVLEAWRTDWLSGGTAEVRFVSPVFDHDLVTCRVDDDTITAVGPDGTVRAATQVTLGDRGPVVVDPPDGWQPDGSALPDVDVRLAGEFSSAYAQRAGDDLPLCPDLGVVHPAVWPALANHVTHAHVVRGSWIHLRSRIHHHGLARDGEVATVRSSVVARRQHKGRDIALLEVRIAVGERTVATIEHEAIVRLPG